MTGEPTPLGVTLFRARARNASGEEVRFVIRATPNGLSFIGISPEGEQYGVRLDREGTQRVRHAITGWLVDAAPTSDPPRAA